jgi:hypothetical protein
LALLNTAPGRIVVPTNHAAEANLSAHQSWLCEIPLDGQEKWNDDTKQTGAAVKTEGSKSKARRRVLSSAAPLRPASPN